METIILKINNRSKAGKALKDLIDALSGKPNTGVEIVQEKSPYNPEFVKKIERARKQKGIILDTNNIWGSLGLK